MLWLTLVNSGVAGIPSVVFVSSITLSGVSIITVSVIIVMCSSVTLSGVVIVIALISFVHPAMVIIVTGARISSGWPSV